MFLIVVFGRVRIRERNVTLRISLLIRHFGVTVTVVITSWNLLLKMTFKVDPMIMSVSKHSIRQLDNWHKMEDISGSGVTYYWQTYTINSPQTSVIINNSNNFNSKTIPKINSSQSMPIWSSENATIINNSNFLFNS